MAEFLFSLVLDQQIQVPSAMYVSQPLHSISTSSFKSIFFIPTNFLSFVQQMPGFVRLLTATDIPQKGKNNYTPFPGNEPEPVSQRIWETVSFVATVNTGCKSEKCAIQSNCRSFESCFLIGPRSWCSCNQKLWNVIPVILIFHSHLSRWWLRIFRSMLVRLLLLCWQVL